MSAGLFESICLSVANGGSQLNPSIVTSTDDLTVNNKYSPDWYAALGKAHLGLVYRPVQKLIVGMQRSQPTTSLNSSSTFAPSI